jgi:hypothetical protein
MWWRAIIAASTVVAALTVGAGRARDPAFRVASPADIKADYASALAEAFENYGDEVYRAALRDYASTDEAERVVRSLSHERFDQLFQAALAKRGLSMQGLWRFAQRHARFFHEQDRLHWNRLQTLEATLAAIPLRVRPTAEPRGG